MSIIQRLREKAAWIVTVAIAFALLVFVVEEGLRNKSVFSGSSNTLGSVNGTNIDRIEFEEKFKRIEDRYTQMGYNMDDNSRMQERQRLWNELVEEIILDEQYQKIGIEVTDKELGDYLYGINPPQDFRQQFSDPQTGAYDANRAYEYVNSVKKQKNSPQYKLLFGEYFPALVKVRSREKFEDLVSNSSYAPKWLIEKTTAENSQIASISYVAVPYTTIPDSSIKVTDAEVKEYVDKNRSLFKQEKAGGIEYVFFSGAPSKADSAALFSQLQSIKDSFATTSDVKQFLLNENSQLPYYDGHITRREIKIEGIDSIIKTPLGSVYGPYLDGSSYVLARVVSIKNIPDTVKVRHILIATEQRGPNGQSIPVRDDITAKNLADSIEKAIKGGANFDTLCLKYSDDGTKTSGGIYEKVVSAQMVPEFNDFIFTNPAGTKGVVRTEYGYHYVEVLSQKGSSPGYKIAYLSKTILPSDETDNNAQSLASQFAAQNRSKKQFDENSKKQNLEVYNAAEIKPLDANVMGVGLERANAREMVRWIFNDAKKGEVAETPFQLQMSNGLSRYSVYVVPVVTQLYEEGVMDVDRARPNSEYKIRQQKKVKQIVEKIGSANTLDAVSKVVNQPVLRADSVSFATTQIPGVGYEPRVTGAAFHKNNKDAVSKPIAGESGVFVIKTENVAAVPNPGMDVKAQQSALQQQMRMFGKQTIVENLKKLAKIKDNRYRFF